MPTEIDNFYFAYIDKIYGCRSDANVNSHWHILEMIVIGEFDDHFKDLLTATDNLANETRILGAFTLGAHGECLIAVSHSAGNSL